LTGAVRAGSRREPLVRRILVEVKLIEAHGSGVTVQEAEIAAVIMARDRPGVLVVIDDCGSSPQRA
jgi:hypothetical protein